MKIETPKHFKSAQENCVRLQFTSSCPEFPTNADLINVINTFSGKVYLEVIIAHNLFEIELVKYKFIKQLKKVGSACKCDLSIARYDYKERILVLNNLR